MKQFTEKKHRLDSNNYTGRVIASFTICVEQRKNIFTRKGIVDKVLEILCEVKNKYKCVNWAYIFMPDHLHLVLEGKSDNSNLLKAIFMFKQITGYWFSKSRIKVKWQKDFYDHILRKDEELKKHIFYILNNPVRKRLVDKWENYPFCGSLDFDLDEIVRNAS